jgi:hypothetical protein
VRPAPPETRTSAKSRSSHALAASNSQELFRSLGSEREAEGRGGVGGGGGEPFRNILNRSDKGYPASRPDVSGQGIFTPPATATVWEWCGAGVAGGTRRQAGRS